MTRNEHATTGVSLVKCKDHCHPAIADATLGDNTIGEVLHGSARSLESGHLHAAIVVVMDVKLMQEGLASLPGLSYRWTLNV